MVLFIVLIVLSLVFLKKGLCKPQVARNEEVL